MHKYTNTWSTLLSLVCSVWYLTHLYVDKQQLINKYSSATNNVARTNIDSCYCVNKH